MRPTNSCHNGWRRRDFIKLLGATAVAGPVFSRGTAAKAATSKVIKIGFVSPRTGRAAGFGEPDGYVLGLARKALASGLSIGGTTYDVQIIDKDGQSNPQRGAQVANDLINADGVDLMLNLDTGNGQSGVRRVRSRRRPVHLHRRAVGSVVLGMRLQVSSSWQSVWPRAESLLCEWTCAGAGRAAHEV